MKAVLTRTDLVAKVIEIAIGGDERDWHELNKRVGKEVEIELHPVTEESVPPGHQLRFDGAEEWSDDQRSRALDLAAWWHQIATDEVDRTIPKAIEYGSADLKIMGEAMLTLMPQLGKGLDLEERRKVGQELGIAFYVLGKISRLFGAYEQGRMPSDDTWFDLGIYSKMVRRIREVGEWS